ncbi:MAG: hypothetical protein ACLFN0_08435 [Thermovirgaceae bacterium]
MTLPLLWFAAGEAELGTKRAWKTFDWATMNRMVLDARQTSCFFVK